MFFVEDPRRILPTHHDDQQDQSQKEGQPASAREFDEVAGEECQIDEQEKQAHGDDEDERDALPQVGHQHEHDRSTCECACDCHTESSSKTRGSLLLLLLLAGGSEHEKVSKDQVVKCKTCYYLEEQDEAQADNHHDPVGHRDVDLSLHG